MAEAAAKIRVLVVQYWIRDLQPIRDALHTAQLDVELTRVDIEPALHAALSWARYDIVLYDPATITVSHEVVKECLHANRHYVPLIVIEDIARLGDQVRGALEALRN